MRPSETSVHEFKQFFVYQMDVALFSHVQYTYRLYQAKRNGTPNETVPSIGNSRGRPALFLSGGRTMLTSFQFSVIRKTCQILAQSICYTCLSIMRGEGNFR